MKLVQTTLFGVRGGQVRIRKDSPVVTGWHGAADERRTDANAQRPTPNAQRMAAGGRKTGGGHHA